MRHVITILLALTTLSNSFQATITTKSPIKSHFRLSLQQTRVGPLESSAFPLSNDNLHPPSKLTNVKTTIKTFFQGRRRRQIKFLLVAAITLATAIRSPPFSTPLSLKQVVKSSAGSILATESSKTFLSAFRDLNLFMSGGKTDVLILLLATSLITPLCKLASTSPILGFLAAGTFIGPNGFGLISQVHSTELLAELGIVFFLFEMGIELSTERLKSMKKDVFGLGLSQFFVTATAIALVGLKVFGLPANQLVVLGGGLALSSSAFVLQLLKDKEELGTRHGKSSFGILLFQDLAVVPLLVSIPILAGGGSGLVKALSSATLKAAMALGAIAFIGRTVLNRMFNVVAGAKSQEAFLGVTLLTVLSMSFLTQGLGLSNTLGAFLAGVLLSETKYKYQIEAEIAPFRGILLGLFFCTVGFEIDILLILSQFKLIFSLVTGIIFTKAAVTTLLAMWFGLSFSNAQQTGLLLSQGGEFAFVAFGLAKSLGIFDARTTKILLTSVALTMSTTPLVASLARKIGKKLEEKTGFEHYLVDDKDAIEIKDSGDDFVVVVGYGNVGKIVCDLLNKKFIKYIGLELNPQRAIEARNKGLPVFFGDITRPEVAEAFNCGKAKKIILTLATMTETNRAVSVLKRLFPTVEIFATAVSSEHVKSLEARSKFISAMVPVLPQDSALLSLPFGGAVLESMDVAKEEVVALMEEKRKGILIKENSEVQELEKLVKKEKEEKEREAIEEEKRREEKRLDREKDMDMRKEKIVKEKKGNKKT